MKYLSVPHTYTVIDVETTGLFPNGLDRISEIAAIRVEGDRIVEHYSSLVNPIRRISAKITEITGITNQMVAAAPLFSEIAQELLTFIGESIFVAHNALFDFSFIKSEFRRVSISFEPSIFCTYIGMRRAYPELVSCSLKNLCHEFGIELEQQHRALSDAKATAELLLLLLEKDGGKQELIRLCEAETCQRILTR